jgi:hypothetical protein
MSFHFIDKLAKSHFAKPSFIGDDDFMQVIKKMKRCPNLNAGVDAGARNSMPRGA